MSTVNIITLIAIILFARLGVRLFFKYRQLKQEEKEEKAKKGEKDKKESDDIPKGHL